MDYGRYQKIVASQITKYGKVVVFHFHGPEDYDPIAGTATAELCDEEVRAVMVSPDEKSFRTGTVRHGDAALIIDGKTLSRGPTPNDTVTVDGEEWKILTVSRVAPAELVIIYKVYLRRA